MRFGGNIDDVTRISGYAVVLALVATVADKHRIGSQLGVCFPVIVPVWAIYVGFLLMLAGYVAGLLILTCRRPTILRLDDEHGEAEVTGCALSPADHSEDDRVPDIGHDDAEHPCAALRQCALHAASTVAELLGHLPDVHGVTGV